MLAFFALVNILDKIVVGMVAVPMMNDFSLSAKQFGVIAGGIYWLFAVSGVVGGFVANRVQTRWLLLGMAILWSLVQIPILLTSSLTILLICRVVLGIGEGPAAPVQNHSIYKWFPNHKRNLPITVLNLGASVGLLIAGVAIPLITARWGWRANFAALGLIGFVWSVVWFTFAEEGTVEETENKGSPVEHNTEHRAPYRLLLTEPTIIGIFLIHFVAYWGFALGLTWLPAYLQKGLGFDGVTAGRLYALIVLLSVPINLSLSWFSQRHISRGGTSRWGRAILTCVALLTAGVLFCMPLGVELSGLQKVLVLALASGLVPIIFSLGPAMISEVTPPEQRGAILAIDNSIASTAGILAPVIMGWLIDATTTNTTRGFEYGFAVSGLLLIAGALIGLILLSPDRSRARFMAASASNSSRGLIPSECSR